MNSDLLEIVGVCLDICNTQDENDFLSHFVTALQQNGDSDLGFDDLDLTEKDFFREVVQANPAPHCSLETLCEAGHQVRVSWKIAEELDWFAFYVYHRRYGWPDLIEEEGRFQVCLPESVGRWRWSKKEEELKYKTDIVKYLDIIILWLRHQPVSTLAIHMYSSALRLATKSPVTRLQLTMSCLDWLKERLNNEAIEDVHNAITDLLIITLTDVWSSIRVAAVNRLGPLVEKFSLVQLKVFLETIFKLCEPKAYSWQTTDGAIQAIHAIIKRFHYEGYSIENGTFNSAGLSPRIQAELRFGSHTFERLPTYISHRVKVLVYQLISNEQLTIRETAIKTFIACLNRGSDRDFESAFHEVHQKLQKESLSFTFSKNDSTQTLRRASLISAKNDFAFMNAYMAESFLNLSLLLLKRIPDQNGYLENWYVYHDTFDTYLMHPASSVRLAASVLYKYVVARSLSSPKYVKSILFNLMRHWQPKQDRLLQSTTSIVSQANSVSTSPCHRLSLVNYKFGPNLSNLSDAWEWREGRLLVYELVSKVLLRNHFLHSFHAASLSSAGLLTSGEMGVTFDSVRNSKYSLHHGIGDTYPSQLSPLASVNEFLHEDFVEEAGDSRKVMNSKEVQLRNRNGYMNDAASVNNPYNFSLWDKTQSYSTQQLRHSLATATSGIGSSRLSNSLSTSDPSLNQTICISSLEKRRSSHEISGTEDMKNMELATINTGIEDGSRIKHLLYQKLSNFPSVNNSDFVESFLVKVRQVESIELGNIERDRVCSRTVQSAESISDDSQIALPSFRSLACQMFHTCSETLADSQWELRRIAKQAFPFLGEVLRWYDPSLVCDLISTHMVYNPTLMTYSCLLLLRDTLFHIVQLRPLLFNYRQHFQSEESLKCVEALLNNVQSTLSVWLRSCQHYLRRQCFDCILPGALHVVILSCLHFSVDTPPVSELLESVVNAFLRFNSIILSGTKSCQDKTLQTFTHEIYPSLLSLSSVGSGPNDPIEYIVHLLVELDTSLTMMLTKSSLELVLPLMPTFVGWMPKLKSVRGTDSSQAARLLLKCCLQLIERTESSYSTSSSSKETSSEAIKRIHSLPHEVDQFISNLASIIVNVEDQDCWWLNPTLTAALTLIALYDTNSLSVSMEELFKAIAQRVKTEKKVGNTKKDSSLKPIGKCQLENLTNETLNNGHDNVVQLSHTMINHVNKHVSQIFNRQVLLRSSQAQSDPCIESEESLKDSDEENVVLSLSETLAASRRRSRTSSNCDSLLSSNLLGGTGAQNGSRHSSTRRRQFRPNSSASSGHNLSRSFNATRRGGGSGSGNPNLSISLNKRMEPCYDTEIKSRESSTSSLYIDDQLESALHQLPRRSISDEDSDDMMDLMDLRQSISRSSEKKRHVDEDDEEDEVSDWDSSDSEILFNGRSTQVNTILIAFINSLASLHRDLYLHVLKAINPDAVTTLESILSIHI